MPSRRDRGPRPVRLALTRLEDRATPAAAAYDPARVLVTFADPAAETRDAPALAGSPMAAAVVPLGLGAYRVDLRPGVGVGPGVAALARSPGVSTAGPDYRVAADSVPNDPSFPAQWGLAAISAPQGWAVATGTGQTVVAVIDSGVDLSHPDLAANLWRNPSAGADGFAGDVNGVNFVTNTGTPADDLGHGTHVAGIIGAVGNNGTGVAGVAWHTRVMALKFESSTGVGYDSDAIRALDFAVAHGAKVVNNSWGGGGYDPALLAAFSRAQAAGVVIVCSAGNTAADTDTSPFYPAGYISGLTNVVTVAAADQTGNLASFSNWGPNTVTLAAPGVNILSTLPGGGYGLKSGTSMAAPFVSGALAVLWDLHPAWSAQQVIAQLKASVDVHPGLVGRVQTGGELDLAKLLGASPPPAAVPPAVPPPPAAVPPPPGAVAPPPATSGGGPAVVGAGFGGPRAGVFDRVGVVFNRAIDPGSFGPSAVSVTGPGGVPVAVSAVVANGPGNTSFYVMFSRDQSAGGSYTLTLRPVVRDAAGRLLDQNGDGAGGTAADTFTFSNTLGNLSVSPPPPAPPAVVSPPPVPIPPVPITVGLPAAGTKVYTSSIPAAVAAFRTTRVDIPVADTFTVADLSVGIDITYGRTWDLSIRVVAPNGRMVTLFNRRGGTGANLSGTVFSDGAAAGIGAAAAPFAGTFRPEQPLGGFAGLGGRGVWSVQVSDLAGGYSGQVNGVTLNFTAG